MTLKDPNNPIFEFVDNDSNQTETKDENDDDKDTLNCIGGADISKGTIDSDMDCAGLVILEYPSLKQVCHKFKMVRYNKPYIAVFLHFEKLIP